MSPNYDSDMQNTEEWWHRMFRMHTKLMESLDASNLLNFRKELDTISYVYAHPMDGLGIGASFVKEIAGWYDDASRWCLKNEDYDGAIKYLERALDYYCDPTLDYDDNVIDDAKKRMHNLVVNSLVGIYEGCHSFEQ